MRSFLVATAAVAVVAAVVPAGPVSAHGAPTTPISRSAACAGNGTSTGAAACKAAKAATGGFIGAFDNLRIANVNGNDRKVVPDGKLCSGGLDAYRGLDLPRDDFPSTSVKSGQTLKVAYRGTILHQGQFRIFLTKSGYDPAKRLTWDDLGSKPVGTFTDPPLTGGAYRMSVKLPERTGRHILYVVWETSSTPDTYYSCSDLVFPAAAPVVKKTTKPPAKPAASATSAAATASVAPVSTRQSAAPVVEATSEPSVEPTAEPVLAATSSQDDTAVGHWLIGGALGAAAIAGMIALVGRRRRRS